MLFIVNHIRRNLLGDKINVMVSLEGIQCISVTSLLAGVIKVY